MSLKDTVKNLRTLLHTVTSDLTKAENGNKAASQRVRTGTIRLEKLAKHYRRESIKAERSGNGKKPKSSKGSKAPKVSKASKAPKHSKSAPKAKAQKSSSSSSSKSKQKKRATAKILKKK